jgi:hypothetical protein
VPDHEFLLVGTLDSYDGKVSVEVQLDGTALDGKLSMELHQWEALVRQDALRGNIPLSVARQ